MTCICVDNNLVSLFPDDGVSAFFRGVNSNINGQFIINKFHIIHINDKKKMIFLILFLQKNDENFVSIYSTTGSEAMIPYLLVKPKSLSHVYSFMNSTLTLLILLDDNSLTTINYSGKFTSIRDHTTNFELKLPLVALSRTSRIGSNCRHCLTNCIYEDGVAFMFTKNTYTKIDGSRKTKEKPIAISGESYIIKNDEGKKLLNQQYADISSCCGMGNDLKSCDPVYSKDSYEEASYVALTDKGELLHLSYFEEYDGEQRLECHLSVSDILNYSINHFYDKEGYFNSLTILNSKGEVTCLENFSMFTKVESADVLFRGDPDRIRLEQQ